MPPPLPGQSVAPLAPWTPPVQGRPVTLPAFEAPIAPIAPSPIQATPVAANAFEPPAQSLPSEQAADDNPFARSMQVNPFAQPVPAHAFARPKPAAAEAPAGQARSVTVTAAPTTAPPTTAPPAPLLASRSERPVYTNAFEPEEDVNPVVRPLLEEGARTNESARPAVDRPLQASAVAEPVTEANARTAEAAPAETPSVDTLVSAETPISERPISVETSSVETSSVETSSVETSSVETSSVETSSVETSNAKTSVTETSVAETPIQITAHANAPAALLGNAAEPELDAPVQARAFETAPTEFAASETPIERAPDAPAHDFAPAAREESLTATDEPSEASSPGSAESVVAEAEIQEQPAQPFPGAARSFTSSGSEMPVVITTPAPYRRDNRAPASKLLDLGRELLPRARTWSKKNLRATPRAAVVAAPLIALLGIWAVRSLVSHPKPAVSETNTDAVSQLAAAKPAEPVATAANVASPASAILVSTSAAPTAAPPGADPAELSSAVSHGLPALEALAQKYPNDAQVGIALASQQAQAQRFEAAVNTVERVITLDAKTAESGKVMGIFWRAAQSDASEASFLALRKLGARGADVAFDLATTSGVRDSVRERAKTELRNSLATEASEDTRVASALLLAPDCSARKALLARAEREGGKRTRTLLEQYSRGSACTSTTDPACNACLTGSPALAHALSQLSAGGHP